MADNTTTSSTSTTTTPTTVTTTTATPTPGISTSTSALTADAPSTSQPVPLPPTFYNYVCTPPHSFGALPVNYDFALHEAQYWRTLAFFLLYHTMLVAQTVDELPPHTFPVENEQNNNYYRIISESSWPTTYPNTQLSTVQEILRALQPFLLDIIHRP